MTSPFAVLIEANQKDILNHFGGFVMGKRKFKIFFCELRVGHCKNDSIRFPGSYEVRQDFFRYFGSRIWPSGHGDDVPDGLLPVVYGKDWEARSRVPDQFAAVEDSGPASGVVFFRSLVKMAKIPGPWFHHAE